MPPLTSEAECNAGGDHWSPGTGLVVNFYAGFDLNIGEDGRVVGKINGEYKDQALLARGVLNEVNLPGMGRLTINDAVVSLSMKRACHGVEACTLESHVSRIFGCTGLSWTDNAA
jgi:hypothetical protein